MHLVERKEADLSPPWMDQLERPPWCRRRYVLTVLALPVCLAISPVLQSSAELREVDFPGFSGCSAGSGN